MVACALVLASAAWAGAAEDHLLAGAAHFRAGRYPEALVELKVAHQLGADPEVRWYLAATLVKTGRPHDALEAFAEAQRLAPHASDALLDYYRALACYDARLYLCADQGFAAVERRAGPRLAEQIGRIRAELKVLFAAEPSPSSIAWYREQGEAMVAAGRRTLAIAFHQEALALGQRRKDCHLCAASTASLAQARATRPPEPTR